MKFIYHCFTVLVLAFLTVYSITPFIIRFAQNINFVDKPNARKIHKKAIPLMGGLAVFLGFIIIIAYVLLVNLSTPSWALFGYLCGALIITIVGLIDDRFGMKPILKLIGQLLSCCVFIYFNHLTGIFGPFYISLPIIFLWMVGLMNALNFLDNMDGIITGMSGILALGFYALSFISYSHSVAIQANFMALLSLIFAGSVFGFLPHNFNPAKIFLGDAGSMFIGYFLSSMGILAGKLVVIRMNNKLYYLLPVLLLSYAIFDISLVSITRKRDGRKISQGGKDHSTHRIDNAMRSPRVTATIVYLINIIIVLVTILVLKMESTNLLILSTALFAIVFIFFGNKLDQIPIVITDNQLRNTNGKDTE